MDTKIIELIQSAQQGNQSAFRDLISCYDDRVSKLIFSLVRNQQDAEDLYQEIFIRVWKKINTYEFRSDFYSWLYRLTMNVCYTHMKKEARGIWEELDDLPDTYPLKLSVLQDSETERTSAVYNRLYSLPPRMRTVVVMFYLEDSSVRSISSILKIGEGTIKKYLFRAREILKQELVAHA